MCGGVSSCHDLGASHLVYAELCATKMNEMVRLSSLAACLKTVTSVGD